MPTVYHQSQKSKYRITLEIEALADFDLIRLTGRSYSNWKVMSLVMRISKTCQILVVGDRLSVVGDSN